MTPVVLCRGHEVLRVHYFDTDEEAQRFAASWMVGARVAVGLGYTPREPRALLPTLHPDSLLEVPDPLREAVTHALRGD